MPPNPKPPARMMPLIVVNDVEPLRAFYTGLLGFEEVTYRSAGDGGGAFVSFAYNSFPVGFSTPDALPELPGPTTNLMVVFEVPDAAAIQAVMATRMGDSVTGVREAPWGQWFQVVDPVGTVVRFIQIAESPDDESAP